MTWVKVDDSFPRHPKVLGLSADVKWAYIEALCYCAQYLTDGRFAVGVIGEAEVAALVDAGLVELHGEGGFLVHNYLEYNPSREAVKRKSRATSNAARVRWADAVQSETGAEPMQDALQNGKQNAERNGMQNGKQDGKQDALGVRVGVGSKALALGSKNKDQVTEFDRFWIAYPKHVGKIKARQEFDAIVGHGADPEAVIAAAERYRDDTDRDPAYTAHPSTWLHQGRWLDEPGESAEDRGLAMLRRKRGETA